jgi:group I intron endonuclease
MPDVYGRVYLITNKVNGKKYVGQTTKSVLKRFAQHLKGIGGAERLSRAVKKYGASSFSVVVLGVATSREDLDSKEMYWVEVHQTRSPGGYNLTGGGKGTTSPSDETRFRQRMAKLGKPLSEEHRKNAAEATRARYRREDEEGHTRKRSIETRERMRESHLGLTQSDETKEKRAAKLRGKKRPDVGEKIREHWRNGGHPIKQEVREHLSRINKGKVLSQETRAAMSSALKASYAAKRAKGLPAKVFTEETRAKMSASALASWAKRRS